MPWIKRKHGEVSFYLTQLLSSHGHCGLYFHKMGKAMSADCLTIEDNVQHTFFNSVTWSTRTASLVADIGTIASDNIIGVMLRGE